MWIPLLLAAIFLGYNVAVTMDDIWAIDVLGDHVLALMKFTLDRG
jgi:hypothetical protein